MHNNSNDYDNISERFLLNGQILIDDLRILLQRLPCLEEKILTG